MLDHAKLQSRDNVDSILCRGGLLFSHSVSHLRNPVTNGPEHSHTGSRRLIPRTRRCAIGTNTQDSHDRPLRRPRNARPCRARGRLFARLPDVLREAMAAPAYAERLQGIDPAAVTSRAALARLPVLRKSELPALHKAAPPFGGFVPAPPARSAGCSPRPGRSSSRRPPTPTRGAARGRCSRRASGPATSC